MKKLIALLLTLAMVTCLFVGCKDSNDDKGGNSGNYKNPAFDAMMDKALSASSTEEADKYYQQGEEILLQDLPAIPLWNQNATAVSTSAVSGVEFDYGGGPVFTALTKKQ